MKNGFDIKEVSYDLGALSIHGLACGNKDDDVVLCLHGWLDNAASFVPLMQDIAKHKPNKYYIAIDWFGHGLSSHRSTDAHYHFFDWVYDLLQLFELNQWEHIDIIGHSMGGIVASAFAAAFPEKVRSLTLIDIIGFVSEKEELSTAQLRKGMLSRLKASSMNQSRVNLKKKSLYPNEELAIKARIAASDLSYEQAAFIVNRGLKQENKAFVWRYDNRLKIHSPYRVTLKQAEQFIKDIVCPVQLIYGSKGLDSVTSGLKIFAPLFQNFISYKLEGGHHVHMEQPEELALLLNDFYTKL